MKYLVARTLVNAVEREPIRTMGENLNKTEGILLIGTLLASTAYGITTMQTYMWYRNYPKESMLIRAVVWSLFMHVIYYYLILNFDNPAALKLSVWSFDSTIALTAVITCIAHGFYARRVYILANRNWFLPTVIAILSGIRLVFGCIIVKRLYVQTWTLSNGQATTETTNCRLVIKVVAELPHKIGMIVGISMGSASLADWIITAALVILLRRRRSGVRE
ncbi:uncharacterized protein B0H18DRAFT_555265 [Fomitopsis serialis]|uniref:uncharacterized protein n=1 Tax=Fomitopsis serialis TaxID=139415 RepID=UPI002007EAF0|nr:uncharacterized protein B0H18DRAFT_555265 [Neoantrodia serialis]KAH9934329.1 hypothetical protein B0H18DRAFT_555265 [Neoantrodia serialis]